MSHYWVDEAHGDDGNDGLTPETAFRTRQRAMKAMGDVPPISILVTTDKNGNWVRLHEWMRGEPAELPE